MVPDRAGQGTGGRLLVSLSVPLAEEATEYVWLSDAGVNQYYYRVRQLLQMDGLGQGCWQAAKVGHSRKGEIR